MARYSKTAEKLLPHLLQELNQVQPVIIAAAGGGGGLAVHDIAGAYHSGTLDESQAPWAVTTTTFGLHEADPDAHHNQSHALVGGDHTASGLTVGHVVRASGATAFAWAQLQHADLGGVTANQHHNQVHNVVGSDHTISGSQFQLVGATGTNTLGLLTPAYNPGAAAAILRSSASGELELPIIIATTRVRTPLIDTASGNMALSPAADLNITPTGDVSLNPSGGEIYIPGNRTLRSSSWTSGVLGSGWGIQERGGSGKSHLDIRSIYTDELIATTFTADQVRVRSGSDWLGESLAIAARDNSDAKVTIPNVGGGSVRIYVEDAPEVTGQIFDANEYVLIKTINRSSGLVIRETWGQVSSYIAESGGRQSYSWTTVSGTGGFTLEPGTALIGFGASGGSYIYRSVIESGKGPFERFATWSTNPYTPANRVSRVEIGDIKNAAGDSTTRYGIAAGNNLALTPATGFSGFAVDNVYGARLYNGLLEMYTGGSKFLGIDSTNGIEIASNLNSASDQRGVTFLDGSTTVAGVWGFHTAGGQISLQMGAVGAARDVQTLITSVTSGAYDRRTTIAADGPSIEVRRSPADAQTIALTAASGVSINGGTAWHSGNDGSGSGLDADKLDTYEATAFALLAGRSGGQLLNGGTASGDDLYIDSTAHVTKGDILLAPFGGNVSIGNGYYAASATLEITKNGYTTVGPTMRLNNNSVGGVGDAARVEFYDAGSLRAYLEWQIISGGSPKWLFYDAFNSATRLEIGGDGLVNVGAATNTYSAKLAVNGNVHAYGGVVSADDYLQVKQRSGSPGGATGFGRIYYDSGDDNLKYITSGGTVRTLSYT